MRAGHALSVVVCGLIACGGDDGGGDDGPLFPEVEECDGQAIVPFSGQHPMVISSLAIGASEDGFDLDRDGEPDNQLAGIGVFADGAFADEFAKMNVILPLEFFDFEEPGPDGCVKLAVYIGAFKLDRDGDGHETAERGGDCNDLVATIGPGNPEIAGNRRDDDCDGLADEVAVEGEPDQPSDDTLDMDDDGYSLADGDCDDTNADVHPGRAEICGDGLDNDCDGVADFTVGAAVPVCTPYDRDTPDVLRIDPLSLEGGQPKVAFTAARVAMVDGALRLTTAPSIFRIDIPLDDRVNLELKISGATLEGDLVMTPGGWALDDARLGGVIDARTADAVRGLDVKQIDLRPEDSLLDAIFANVLSVFLGLRKAGGDGEFADCHVPDIDVDRDGLEIFCDSDPNDDVKTVDVCVDGDGTVVRDGDDGVAQCTDAVDADGKHRFQDGISIVLKLTTAPARLGGLIGE
jgi:hypothetical protein